MSLVPDRRRGGQDEGARYHDGHEGEAEEEEGPLGHHGAVAGREGGCMGCRAKFAILEHRHFLVGVSVCVCVCDNTNL